MEAYHDRYQIEEISHDVYHCKYEIRKIMLESVSLYTLKRQFISDITQCTHTSRKVASSRALFYRPTVKTRKSCDLDGKHRKNVHFCCFRVYPNPICRLRAERRSAQIDPMRFKFSNTTKEELPSKQNTICTLK